MITAESEKFGTVQIDSLCNRGGWFGETWLIACQEGFMHNRFIIVEASCEDDAIEVLTDSKYGHLIKTDKLCEACEAQETLLEKYRNHDQCACSFAGYYSDRVNLDRITAIERVKVNYFARKAG